MTKHKFELGARVSYRSSWRRDGAGADDYVVARLLPPDAEGHQYRIESRSGNLQRVVHECELSRRISVF